MNPNPNYIEISSDSESLTSPPSSEDPNPWIPIQPPAHELTSPFICTSSDEEEPQNNPPATPSEEELSNLPRWIYDSEAEDSTECLEPTFTQLMQQEIEKAAASFLKLQCLRDPNHHDHDHRQEQESQILLSQGQGK